MPTILAPEPTRQTNGSASKKRRSAKLWCISAGLEIDLPVQLGGQNPKLSEVVEHCPDAQVHLDLTYAGNMDLDRLTTAVGPQLTELKLPETPDEQDIYKSRVSWSCGRLTLSHGRKPGEYEHLEGALKHTGHSVAHFEYRAASNQRTCDVEEPLQIMANRLRMLQKLVFDCALIRTRSFQDLAKANPELREVYLRVYLYDPGQVDPDPTKEQRVAGRICTFAANPEMKSIAIEQKCRTIDALPYVCLEQVRDHCSSLRWRKKKEIHIQVFAQALFPRS